MRTVFKMFILQRSLTMSTSPVSSLSPYRVADQSLGSAWEPPGCSSGSSSSISSVLLFSLFLIGVSFVTTMGFLDNGKPDLFFLFDFLPIPFYKKKTPGILTSASVSCEDSDAPTFQV